MKVALNELVINRRRRRTCPDVFDRELMSRRCEIEGESRKRATMEGVSTRARCPPLFMNELLAQEVPERRRGSDNQYDRVFCCIFLL